MDIMELKSVYDEKIFKNYLKEIKEEYKNDPEIVFDKKRIASEKQDLKDKKSSLFCLLDNKNILAYLCVKFENGIIIYYNLLVKKAYREKGYGSELFNLVESKAKGLGYKKIVLASRRGREDFYLKQGCSASGLLQVDVLNMTKDEIKQLLKVNNIKINKYKIMEGKTHQFYIVVKNIKETMEKFDAIKNEFFHFQIFFEKNIV